MWMKQCYHCLLLPHFLLRCCCLNWTIFLKCNTSSEFLSGVFGVYENMLGITSILYFISNSEMLSPNC